MLIGVAKEIENHEYRVGLTPGSVRELVRHGHQVIVEKNAGSAIGLGDADYAAAGAQLADSAKKVFARAELIVKVKEPQPEECRRLRAGVPGVPPGKVVILGGGVVGSNAALIALGMGADVTIIDRSLDRLRALHGRFGERLHTVHLTEDAIEANVAGANLVVGAILVRGATTPRLLRREQLKKLRPGSVLVDVSIDQGGCFETSHPTTHADPTFVVDGIVHYCVANIPGAVTRTATFALNNATLPFALALADQGSRAALLADPHLRNGLNIHQCRITCAPVAEALGMDWLTAAKVLGQEQDQTTRTP